MPIIFLSDTSSGSTLLSLRTEFKARGYDYFSDDRANRYINLAYTELCEAMPWPFLESSTAGVPPLLPTYFRAVLAVRDTNSNSPIAYEDFRNLIAQGADLTATGDPVFWYLRNASISTYPLSPNSITIDYVIYAPDLVNDTDQTYVPSRWTNLIVDGAVIKALKDDDEYQSAAALRQDYDRQVTSMVNSYFQRHLDGPSFIRQTSCGDC